MTPRTRKQIHPSHSDGTLGHFRRFTCYNEDYRNSLIKNMYSWHEEAHFSRRSNWLRAGVLGANDGMISVSNLLIIMVAANASFKTLLLAGVASLIAGAIAMAAGEYVSVSSQMDSEDADKNQEMMMLKQYPDEELRELTLNYQLRGLSHEMAYKVACVLTRHDALAAHMRDEVGISEVIETNALQAASVSALAFASGGLVPLLVILSSAASWQPWLLGGSTLFGLVGLGAISARLGGAPVLPAMIRIAFWGMLALGVSSAIGVFLKISV